MTGTTTVHTPTLEIDDFDDEKGLYTGTILVEGERMQVWVPADMAEEAMDRAAGEAQDQARNQP